MLTADYHLRDPILDAPQLPYHQKAPSAWYAADTSSASGSFVIFPLDPYLGEPALTQPLIDFEEEVTQLSFKVSSEPVGLAFFGDVVGSPTVPFRREFEDDLGE
jgi:hypothetical protein